LHKSAHGVFCTFYQTMSENRAHVSLFSIALILECDFVAVATAVVRCQTFLGT